MSTFAEMIVSNFRSGSGAILVESREERRVLRETIAALPPETKIGTIAAPGGIVKNARTGQPAEQGLQGLQAAYTWAMSSPGRCLVVYDFHTIINNAGQWRTLAEALPGLRGPKGAKEGDPASLVIFVGPQWQLDVANPLKGILPKLDFEPPDRAAIAKVAGKLRKLNGEAEQIVDALCGLSADAAEQAAAEVLARTGGQWDCNALRDARKSAIREAGLEIWPATAEIGGLQGLRDFTDAELIPWIRDPQLSVRRLLMAGLPGTGKSYYARYVANKLGCECARLSVPSLKAGIVGASEGNLRRALRTLDSMGKHAPIVAVLDEIDTIARDGLDGGTSSGMFAELLTWLQESTSQVVVIATLNRLDKLDAALESRFQARFFFDLGSLRERTAVCEIHYTRLGCKDAAKCAVWTAECTEGFSSRELAEHIIPSVARLSSRKPTKELIVTTASNYTAASKTQAEQLQQMRKAASTLRRANDAEDNSIGEQFRRIVSDN